MNWPEYCITQTLRENPGLTVIELHQKIAATEAEMKRWVKKLIRSGQVVEHHGALTLAG